MSVGRLCHEVQQALSTAPQTRPFQPIVTEVRLAIMAIKRRAPAVFKNLLAVVRGINLLAVARRRQRIVPRSA